MKPETICGPNAVSALFARRPDDVLRLYYTEALRVFAGPFCGVLARSKRPYRLLPPEEMERATGTKLHGGIAAVVKPRPIGLIDFVRPPRHELLLILDGVGNPHNVGAIARSAAFFGVRAMLLHETPEQAMPSDAAYRTAEGALEWLDLYRTRDLPKALAALEPHYRTVAATLQPEAMPLRNLPRDRPVALVLGNEEHGVSPPVVAACRRQVRIIGHGHMQSLNVAQAASVLLYALTDQGL